jgi:hypothetical protein
LVACEVSQDLTRHDLRHTAASAMISARPLTKPAQSALGYSSATAILDWCSHLYDDDLEALAESLNARYGQADAAQVRPRAAGEVRQLVVG